MRMAMGLVILLLPTATATADPIKGAGAMSCSQWVEERRQNTYAEPLHWILGFISAYNQYVYSGNNPNGIFGSADYKAIAVWMDNYCQQNPFGNAYKGITLLTEELRRRAN